MYLKMIALLCVANGFFGSFEVRSGIDYDPRAGRSHSDRPYPIAPPAPTGKTLEITALQNSIQALAKKEGSTFSVQPALDSSFGIMEKVDNCTKKLTDKMNQNDNNSPFFGIYELARDLEIEQKKLKENNLKIEPVANDNPGKKLMDQYAVLLKEISEDAEKAQKRVEDNSNKSQDAIKALLANPAESNITKKLTPIKDLLNQLTNLWANLSAKDLTNVAKVNPELTGAKPGAEIADVDLTRAIDLCTTYDSALKKMRELCTKDYQNLHGLYDVRVARQQTTEQFVFLAQNPFLPAKLQEDTADLCKDLTIKAIESGKIPYRGTFMHPAGMIALFHLFGFQVFNSLEFQQTDGKPIKKLSVKELDGSTDTTYDSSEKAGDALKNLRSALRGEAHMRDYPLEFSTPFHRFTYWLYLNLYSIRREAANLIMDGEISQGLQKAFAGSALFITFIPINIILALDRVLAFIGLGSENRE